MSSAAVRTAIKSFLTTGAPSEDVVDLTSQYGDLPDILDEAGVLPDSPWLGLQFIGNDELPITIPATNGQGKYRETGAVIFHVVDVAKLGVGDLLLTRAEALRDLLRGSRISDIVIVESVSPPNFDSGATLQFDGGFMSGSFTLSYYADFDL